MNLTPTQRDLLIRTIIGEAAAEPFAGQQAVANVVLNRLNAGRYGGHVFGQADGPGTKRDDRGTAFNSGYGEAAPAGLLDAQPYQPSDLPAEPDWEALKEMGAGFMKKAQADQEDDEEDMPMQAQVLQPLRRVTMKGLLG